VERRRKLKICSQESNWRRPARPAAGAVLLLLSVYVQSNKQSVRNMAGGARKENRRERGTALCMSAVTQTTRQGLTAIMPIGAAWW